MKTSSQRIDIISDTHGYLSEALRYELVGANLIVHAGDIISYADYRTLLCIADVQAVLGNNDFEGSYGPRVERHGRFSVDGLVFDVCHFEQRLNPEGADVCVFGHTHRPVLEERPSIQSENLQTLFVNPGSPTFPRGGYGPTMARLWIADGSIKNAEMLELAD